MNGLGLLDLRFGIFRVVMRSEHHSIFYFELMHLIGPGLGSSSPLAGSCTIDDDT